jgi:hypothetical protein
MNASEYILAFKELISAVNVSDHDFIARIRQLLSETPISFQQINIHFIVRTAVLDLGEECHNISRCSYNPDCDKIPLQRCNIEGQQVFYGTIPGGMTNLSDGAQSAFMETCFDRIKEDLSFDNRFIVTTRWMFKKPPLVWVLPFHSGSMELNGNFKFLFDQFDKVLKEISQDETTYFDWKAKAEYLSGLFCCSDNKKATYKITAAVHNRILQNFNAQMEDRLNGLIYPSANTKGEGMNIVLEKDFIIPDNIYCDHATLYYFQRTPGNPNDISFFPIAAGILESNGDVVFAPLKV